MGEPREAQTVDLPAILHTFADLAPAGTARVTMDVSRAQGLVWLGTHLSSFLDPTIAGVDVPKALVQRTERLAAYDQLHRHQQLLREGWVFVAGRTTMEGVRREVCVPLLSAPVRLRQPGRLQPLGDPEITPLVDDADRRAELERRAELGGGGLHLAGEVSASYLERFPRLQTWIREVADAAGLEIDGILPPDTDPLTLRRTDGLMAVVGSGIYAVDREDEPDRRRTLRSWAERPGLDGTAMATVYAGTAPADAPAEPVRSPLPLTAAQRELVVRSRHEDLTVASGAPGTGKSHAVVAIAVDAVLRGESVLVATQSPHAADVLADLLDRHPGPTPLVFGNGERRAELLDELTERLGQPVRRSELDALDAAVARAADEANSARRLVVRSLALEADAAEAERWAPAVPALLADAPRVFDADADLDAVEELIDTVAGGAPDGWFARWRHRRADRRLRQVTGAAPDVPPAALRDALGAARARAAAAYLTTHGGITVGALWERVTAADERLREAVGRRAAAHDRLPASWTGSNRRAVGALLAALRAGRGQRRRALSQLDPGALTGSVPLWVGNLHDIEDLLPAVAGMFDLVVLDEASQIDQAHAGLALLRGRRAVVVGDPRQLRHVSFVSDADVASTLRDRGIDHLADRLDLRRMSAFDAAAAASPVTWLDEHHRSVPHLIEFSARRFYRDRVKLLTRHPRTHGVDVIDVIDVAGGRDEAGVNRAEVAEVLRLLEGAGADGWTSVGVVTPFRAQADAVEQAILDRLSLDEIEALGLRVGTVHAFQGNERDLVVVSLGLGDDAPAASRRFVEDTNLFNVMVTRARRRMVVLRSFRSDEGLLGEYVSWASRPPRPHAGGGPTSAWSAALGAELQRAGWPAVHGYQVGTWEVDLVVGDGDAAVAVECGVHPAGPDAHVERHLAIRSAGWVVVDAFPSRWGGDAARAAVELAASLPR